MNTNELRKAIELWNAGNTLTDIRTELHISYFVLRSYFAAIGINKR